MPNNGIIFNCPYFQRFETMKIRCEGFSTAKDIQINFYTKGKRDTFAKKYCANAGDIFAFKKCPLYCQHEKEYAEK